MSEAWAGYVRQGPAGGEQGDGAAGRHQDNQEEQDRN